MDGWMDGWMDVAMVITLESHYSTGTCPILSQQTKINSLYDNK